MLCKTILHNGVIFVLSKAIVWVQANGRLPQAVLLKKVVENINSVGFFSSVTSFINEEVYLV